MIELQNLSKRYGDGLAVDDVCLSVQRGEMLVLVGGSGSGKTTTLKMVNRLIEPSAGEVRLNGRNVLQQPAWALRRSVGYCFQGVGLFPHLTVAENIGITPSLLGWPQARIRTRVDALLDLMALPAAAYRERMPAQLSGGQQQRIGVARAMAAQPDVVLFDEPFGALDPLTRDHLQAVLSTIRRQEALTGIFVTHDMVEAFLLGDRIAVMQGGRIIQVGTPHTLITAPINAYVEKLVTTPMRQSERIHDLFAAASRVQAQS